MRRITAAIAYGVMATLFLACGVLVFADSVVPPNGFGLIGGVAAIILGLHTTRTLVRAIRAWE